LERHALVNTFLGLEDVLLAASLGSGVATAAARATRATSSARAATATILLSGQGSGSRLLRGGTTAAAASGSATVDSLGLGGTAAATILTPAAASILSTARGACWRADTGSDTAIAACLSIGDKTVGDILGRNSTAAASALTDGRRGTAEQADTNSRKDNANRKDPEWSEKYHGEEHDEEGEFHATGTFKLATHSHTTSTHQAQNMRGDWRNIANRLAKIFFELRLDGGVGVDSFEDAKLETTVGFVLGVTTAHQTQIHHQKGDVDPHHTQECFLLFFKLNLHLIHLFKLVHGNHAWLRDPGLLRGRNQAAIPGAAKRQMNKVVHLIGIDFGQATRKVTTFIS
jgi:hypothetical protein